MTANPEHCNKRFVEVAAALPVSSTYTYSLPDHLQGHAVPGKRVAVPFGRGKTTAYVLETKDRAPEIEIKDILEILDEHPLFPSNMIPFFRWISRYYKFPLGAVIKTALPSEKSERKLQKFVSVTNSFQTDKDIKTGPVKKKILSVVKKSGKIPLESLKEIFPSAQRHVRDLQKAGIVSVSHKRIIGSPLEASIVKDRPPVLNSEQIRVVSRVLKGSRDSFNAFLLTGITGSGKTEVYLHIAADIISQGRKVLVLVPEIALVSQTVQRFRARFGDSLAILHSGLSDGQRFDEWLKIASGQVDIVIGARSAIFAPFENPGLIIVDEEHDVSYKQESGLRYNARDLALVRARQTQCIALLGSATPSLQSYYNVKIGKFEELVLSRRIENRPLARTTIVDLRMHRNAKGARRFLSPALTQAIGETLARNEQVLLFLNRRGFASYPICVTCGSAFQCKNCAVTLTLHKSTSTFKCHFCGYSAPISSHCPVCGSTNIMHLGLGTEKIEEFVKKLFPQARTARMDRDTTRHKGALINLLQDLKNHKTDILVGTQMVAKGHDFPNITLVGIICADLSLNFPDFRASERTFQLLTQVSGRAGRGEMPGEVILQTYNPGHFTILAAREQDFKRFYHNEINFRKSLNYPPFSRLIQLLISGKNREKTQMFVQQLSRRIKSFHESEVSFLKNVEILGPIEAPLTKIAGNYRWHVLLKSLRASPLHNFMDLLIQREKKLFSNRSIKVAVDVDPCLML